MLLNFSKILAFLLFLWGQPPSTSWGQATDFSAVDPILAAAIVEGQTPGAVLAVVHNGKFAYLKAYGKRGQPPFDVPMTADTIFDLASCSKVVGTVTATMILVENGKLNLEDPVDQHLPGFANFSGDSPHKIRIKHLLTHTSGLPPYADVKMLVAQYGAGNKAGLLEHICKVKRNAAPGTNCRYSCLNFIALQHIIERVSGESLRDFTRKHIFERLGMSRTDYLPSAVPIAPTEVQPDGEVLCGKVHDPLARMMNNGVSGNAGLFASAGDLAIFCAMLLNGGEWHGQRVLQAATVRQMLTIPDFAAQFGRTLGWMSCAPQRDTFAGSLTSPSACGHTGYTGTSILIDPEKELAIILLTNRVHPHDRHATGEIRRLRQQVCESIYQATNQYCSRSCDKVSPTGLNGTSVAITGRGFLTSGQSH